MYRICLTCVLLLCFATIASAETKIAFVDMKAIIANSDAGKRAMGTLKNKFQSMKTKLDKQKQDLDKLRTDFKKQAMALSQEAKRDKERQYRDKIRDFQETGNEYRLNLQQEEQRLSKPIIDKILEITEKYAVKHGYTAILDKEGAGLIACKESADITDEILKEVNRALH